MTSRGRSLSHWGPRSPKPLWPQPWFYQPKWQFRGSWVDSSNFNVSVSSWLYASVSLYVCLYVSFCVAVSPYLYLYFLCLPMSLFVSISSLYKPPHSGSSKPCSGPNFLQLPGERMWKKQSENSHLPPCLHISQYMLQSMGHEQSSSCPSPNTTSTYPCTSVSIYTVMWLVDDLSAPPKGHSLLPT